MRINQTTTCRALLMQIYFKVKLLKYQKTIRHECLYKNICRYVIPINFLVKNKIRSFAWHQRIRLKLWTNASVLLTSYTRCTQNQFWGFQVDCFIPREISRQIDLLYCEPETDYPLTDGEKYLKMILGVGGENLPDCEGEPYSPVWGLEVLQKRSATPLTMFMPPCHTRSWAQLTAA